jgi:Tfp pilus assembly protein PilF
VFFLRGTAPDKEWSFMPDTGKTPPAAPSALPLAVMSAFLIIAAGFTAMLQVRGIPLQGEDLRLIGGSTDLHNMVTVPDAFPMMPHAPLTLFSYALNLKIHGGVSMLFAGNILIHLINSVLLFLIARKLLPAKTPEVVAMLAGMIFAVHPLAAGAAGILAGRPVMLGTLFAFISILLFLRAVRAETIAPHYLAAALFAAALAFAGHMAFLAMPFLLLASDLAANGFSRMRRHTAAHALAFGTAALIAAAWYGTGQTAAIATPETLTATLRWQGAALTGFFHDFFAPPGAESLPPAAPGGSAISGVLLIAVILAGGLALALLRSAGGAGLIWIGVYLCAVICMTPEETALSIRQYYFPLAGLALFLPALFNRLKGPPLRAAAGILATLLIAGAIWLSWQATLARHAPLVLWQEAAAKEDAPLRAKEYLAEVLEYRIQFTQDPGQRNVLTQAAASAWRDAIESLEAEDAPDTEAYRRRAELRRHLGRNLFMLGKTGEAESVLEEALRIHPYDGETALLLARLAAPAGTQNRDQAALDRAILYYERAKELDALPPRSLSDYAMALIARGDIRKGVPMLRRALEQAPDENLSKVLERAGRVYQRIMALEKELETLLATATDRAKILELRAEQYLLEGRRLQASYLLETLLKQETCPDRAWLLLGTARAGMNQAESFLEHHGESGTPEEWQALVNQCVLQQHWDAALAFLEAGRGRADKSVPPRLQLADLAIKMRNPARAKTLLEEAAEIYPENPAPWLRRADIAIAEKQPDTAAALLKEAEKRGAKPAELEERREKTGLDKDGEFKPVQTFIR